MKSFSTAFLVASSLLALTATGADAASLPAIKADPTNKVPECATPGRLMAFLAERNAKLDGRFAGIATAYMRHGEELGIRWDYAFFQMILETGNLAYQRGNGKPGDVKPTQNNFAGLGATGNGEPGEKFATVDDGVKAHLQHLLMYSGAHVDDAVAERTRKVQEWGVLTSWQKSFKRPITFTDLAGKWAPGSKGYASDVNSISGNFYDATCKKSDPRPELVQEARQGRSVTTQVAARPATERSKGSELARQAIERAREEGEGTRSALGAKAPAATGAAFSILNDPKIDAAAPDTTDRTPPVAALSQPAPAQPAPVQPAAVQVASAATGPTKAPTAKTSPVPSAETTVAAVTNVAITPKPPVTPEPPQAAPSNSKCRVYTASYGGQRAVIIRSAAEQFTNFTVLDVNEGQEAREIDAYVSAYAKGGQKVGDFANQNAALDKAFQLCPEG